MTDTDTLIVRAQLTDPRLAQGIVSKHADAVPELANIFRIAALYHDDLINIGMYVRNRLEALERAAATENTKGETA